METPTNNEERYDELITQMNGILTEVEDLASSLKDKIKIKNILKIKEQKQILEEVKYDDDDFISSPPKITRKDSSSLKEEHKLDIPPHVSLKELVTRKENKINDLMKSFLELKKQLNDLKQHMNFDDDDEDEDDNKEPLTKKQKIDGRRSKSKRRRSKSKRT